MPLIAFFFFLAAALGPAGADDVLRVTGVLLERPTLHCLGVQVLIAGDDDRDARVEMRVREADLREPGAAVWRAGLPLLRVWPETVWIEVGGQQFAGSLFDLRPDTDYQIELRAIDPDGGAWSDTVEARTRPIPPAEPAVPRRVPVADAGQLQAALDAAGPGDVIDLAAGLYRGPFALRASGEPDNPIVVRGAGAAATVLDGGGCQGCDVLEVHGSHVHVEDLALRAAARGLRFAAEGATADVARRLAITDVVHGIGKAAQQTDFYLCDNLVEGRLAWPWALRDGAESHWDDRGIDIAGDGHVVCHNRIAGFGDPIVNKKVGSRSWDVYGNDIADSYDGTELDEAAGNVRLFRNRYTDVMDPVSIQPIHGGPAYVLRNLGYNIPDEQIKLKSLGGQQLPSGALIYHNTFVSPFRALNLQTPITQYHFELRNNLFIGPARPLEGRPVDWTATVVGGRFDANGYWPDGGFWFGRVDGRMRYGASFAEVAAAGLDEPHGVLLEEGAIFADGGVGPQRPDERHAAPSLALHPGSRAVDGGQLLPGVNDGFAGAGPDLGALELGCPEPTYGPRPRGQEAAVWPVDCGAEGVRQQRRPQ